MVPRGPGSLGGHQHPDPMGHMGIVNPMALMGQQPQPVSAVPYQMYPPQQPQQPQWPTGG
jgi:hypothetical protein